MHYTKLVVKFILDIPSECLSNHFGGLMQDWLQYLHCWHTEATAVLH